MRNCEALNHESGIVEEFSVITCLLCGTAKREPMPVNACQHFYDCTGCGARLKPKAGDCCVFCSYGSIPCPPVQTQRSQRSHDLVADRTK
jgi:hypothetical protein